MYCRTGDAAFLKWFQKIFDYTYQTFPNPDPDIREWIQIRTREGNPQEKVVALPVKDPYHIIRNVLMIIELLENRWRKEL
jgi:N-acylglucosamine 2-epimerase